MLRIAHPPSWLCAAHWPRSVIRVGCAGGVPAGKMADQFFQVAGGLRQLRRGFGQGIGGLHMLFGGHRHLLQGGGNLVGGLRLLLTDAGQLPTIRLKATTAEQAEAKAHITTGKQVLRVERVEG